MTGINKSDFAIGGFFPKDPTALDSPSIMGFTYPFFPMEYRYRTPIGYDDEGKLVYSPYDKSVEGLDWTLPMRIDSRKGGLLRQSRSYPDALSNYNNVTEGKTAREIMSTATHEAGHVAHNSADPLRNKDYAWDEYHENQERGGYGFFDDSDSNKMSVAELAAYTTQYPFDPNFASARIQMHPDVGKRFGKRVALAQRDRNFDKGHIRNLRNAVLDQIATTGKRNLAGNFAFGNIKSVANRKKQAERTAKKALAMIDKLPVGENAPKSFEDLPLELQEEIGKITLREQLSQFMDNNFEWKYGGNPIESTSDYEILRLFRQDPEFFLQNFDPIEPKQKWGEYDLEILPPAVGALPRWKLTPEEASMVEDRWGPEFDGDWWGMKPKVKSNVLTNTRRMYKDPKFGSEAILDDVIQQYGLAEDRGVEFDSSRAFVKAWGMVV